MSNEDCRQHAVDELLVMTLFDHGKLEARRDKVGQCLLDGLQRELPFNLQRIVARC